MIMIIYIYICIYKYIEKLNKALRTEMILMLMRENLKVKVREYKNIG